MLQVILPFCCCCYSSLSALSLIQGLCLFIKALLLELYRMNALFFRLQTVESKEEHCFHPVLPTKINLNSHPLLVLWTSDLDIYSVTYTVLQELNICMYDKICIYNYYVHMCVYMYKYTLIR